MRTKTVLMMAGGTGGHVIPALTIATELQAQGIHVVWLGTPRGIENTLVPKANIRLERISVTGLRGKGIGKILCAPFLLPRALWQAIKILRKTRPQLVLGMGGFASGPGGVAAWLLGIPLVIHEQNAIAGTTNQILAKFARRVLEAFPKSFSSNITESKYLCVGNPIRAEILAIKPPAQRLALRTEGHPFHILVMGGSLGARALNHWVPLAIARLIEEHPPAVNWPIVIWHQTGQQDLEQAKRDYEFLELHQKIEIKIEPFIEQVDKAYAWADVAICRAGALTIAELAVAGVASILIPYPHAIDDHQRHNANYLVQRSAAVLIDQYKIATELETDLLRLMRDRLLLKNMAQSAWDSAKRDATMRIIDVCMAEMGIKKDA